MMVHSTIQVEGGHYDMALNPLMLRLGVELWLQRHSTSIIRQQLWGDSDTHTSRRPIYCIMQRIAMIVVWTMMIRLGNN